ncbi:AAA family ATPase [Propioniciclava coleopterorum]|uniref:AAA family ATPase n=1 Tax=Propioniciclava coleopterorum TaxID=2714937 RepID=A0A6G7Y9W4_9ACTN|nr:ATP-binding protein [Propioniciclava coleopterorum]QIK73612.1 AAA family ATPase [Propioniciclava coleopterorum]
MPNPLIDSLLKAVAASPHDVPLRLHLADLLLAEGRSGEAIAQAAYALQTDPTSAEAQALMARALGGSPSAQAAPDAPTDTPAEPAPRRAFPAPDAAATDDPASAPTPAVEPQDADDWDRAAADLLDAAASGRGTGGIAEPLRDGEEPAPADEVWDVEEPKVTLADVGGLQDVKDRLEVSFLAPLRNPELRSMYGKSLRGGLLLYGPPGCGKTFIARAVAGEMGARFINVTLTDVLDMYVGNSEANLHGIFEIARGRTPCVIFLDEIDAIGQKRSQTRHSATRGVVNQLLQELDGIGSDNEGVYVLAATNTPWDIDPALRRPGRLDRTVLVLPPDEAARLAILGHGFADRPTQGLDLARVAKQTDGYTGADLAHLCESAAEAAMMASIRTGSPQPITQRDVQAALKDVRPSAGPWFETARNVVEYADRSGEYDALRDYMQRRRLL